MIKHLTIAESWCFGEVFARPFPERLPWRDDDADERAEDAKLAAYFDHTLLLADMWATEDESRLEIVDRYRRIWEHSDATIAALDIDAPGHVSWWPRPDVKLFNIMVHVLNETNRTCRSGRVSDSHAAVRWGRCPRGLAGLCRDLWPWRGRVVRRIVGIARVHVASGRSLGDYEETHSVGD